MTNHSASDKALTPEEARHIDRACDAFESAWQSGQRPSIEQYLVKAPAQVRKELLRELLALDIAYRRRGGEQPSHEEYRQRFADWLGEEGLPESLLVDRHPPVQESVLEAQRDLASFNEKSDSAMLPWLRRILWTNVVKFCRRFRRRENRQSRLEETLDGGQSAGEPTREFAADASAPNGQRIAQERIEGLKQALQRLPENFRRVIELRHRNNSSWGEIGVLMNCSAHTVRKMWGQAIRRLQDEMGQPEPLSG